MGSDALVFVSFARVAVCERERESTLIGIAREKSNFHPSKEEKKENWKRNKDKCVHICSVHTAEQLVRE